MSVTSHTLRHTRASKLITAGVPLTEVARILGQVDAQVAATINAHIIPWTSRTAARRVDQLERE